MTGYAKKDDSYKQVDESYVNVDGTWRRVIQAYVKVNGEWKQWYLVPPDKLLISGVANVGTNRPYNNGSFSVSVALPPNSPISATSFRVVATASGQPTVEGTSATSPVTLTGLKSGVEYSVVAYAGNLDGESAPSDIVKQTATTVPQTIGTPTATGGVDQDNLVWSAPANGGTGITQYRWESTDGRTGTSTSTNINIAQDANTSQQYRVRAENANGAGEWSPWSGGVTTLPPFFPPFFPPYFPYFPYFPWFPWFPPWFPWFPPRFPYFPWFVPNPGDCIAADTLVETVNGPVKAKDLAIGDVLVSYSIPEIGIDEEHSMLSWISNSLTLSERVETSVSVIKEKDANIIVFNGDTSARYSTTQPVFIRSNNKYKIVPTHVIAIGDYLVKINDDGTVKHVKVRDINTEPDEDKTYQISCEPYDWFIAGSYLVHNK